MSIRALNSFVNRCTSRQRAGISARRLSTLAAAVVFSCATLSHATHAAAEKDDPPEVGVWIDDTGQGAVKISRCGRSLCGHVFWLQDPKSSKGDGPKRDIYNPNPKNRGNLICGLQVIGRLVPMSDGSWDNGWIYDPKVGQAFDVSIRVLSKRTLEVHGYQSIKILGKTFRWTRTKEELPPCSTEPDQAAAQ